MDKSDQMETFVADLEERIELLQAKLASADKAALASRKLADAVRVYLSWRERPPKDMDQHLYSQIERTFRHNVEYALREIEG